MRTRLLNINTHSLLSKYGFHYLRSHSSKSSSPITFRLYLSTRLLRIGTVMIKRSVSQPANQIAWSHLYLNKVKKHSASISLWIPWNEWNVLNICENCKCYIRLILSVQISTLQTWFIKQNLFYCKRGYKETPVVHPFNKQTNKNIQIPKRDIIYTGIVWVSGLVDSRVGANTKTYFVY